MTRIAQESSAEALQYGPTEGFERTKECIREVMRAEGMEPDLDDIIVTTGGQQAIDLVAKTLVDPGDVVIAEAPTYPGAVPVFCSYEAETIQVAVDGDGMIIEELEAHARPRSPPRAGGRSSSTACPTFQNPAGQTLSAERRRRLVDLVRERELLLVEDNPYGLLRYEGEPQESLYKLDGGDYVIYLGTFSKILSPGIRLGWLCAPPPVMEKVVLGKQASDLCTSTLSQYFVDEYFGEGRWREYIASLCDVYRGAPRRDARGARRVLPGGGDLVAPRGRAVPVGDAAELHRHHRPAGAGAARERRVRPRRGGVRRRPRRQLDAAELLGLGRGRDPRGDQADRAGRRASRSSSTARSRGSTGARSASAGRPSAGRGRRADARRREDG